MLIKKTSFKVVSFSGINVWINYIVSNREYLERDIIIIYRIEPSQLTYGHLFLCWASSSRFKRMHTLGVNFKLLGSKNTRIPRGLQPLSMMDTVRNWPPVSGRQWWTTLIHLVWLGSNQHQEIDTFALVVFGIRWQELFDPFFHTYPGNIFNFFLSSISHTKSKLTPPEWNFSRARLSW